MRLLLSPHDFRNTTDWRLSICKHLLEWIHTDAVHLTFPITRGPPMVGLGRWGSSVSGEYVTTWHNRQEVDSERHRRNLRVWVRDQVVAPSDFRRTQYFGEFCEQHRILDSAGIWHRFPDGKDVVLHFNASRHGTFPVNGRTHALATVLQPVLVAGATAARELGDVDWSRLIDASGRAIGVLSLDGRLLHVTARLGTLASDPAVGAALMGAMKQLTKHAARLMSKRSFDSPIIPSVKIMVDGIRLEATGSIVRERLLSSTPLCLVTVRVADATRPLSSTDYVLLTAREQQVAGLLARGEGNRAIAATLGVSEHTARRHTERVLVKLGVRSRAAVAGALHQHALATSESAE